MAVVQTSEAKVGAASSPASKSEQIHHLVETLSGLVQASSVQIPGRSIHQDLEIYANWLNEAHRYFNTASRQELSLTYASEWVLDNYYIIRQAIREIGQDLPQGYYDELPRLENGPFQGYARIHIIANAALDFMNDMVNLSQLQTILVDLQENVPLTMGELWAVPIFLRYGLIEGLSHTLVDVIRPTSPPDLPPKAVLQPEKQSPAAGRGASGTASGAASAASVSNTVSSASSAIIANAILSLRSISEQDWNEYFESISRVEQTLRTDPAGVYTHMDFKTRDLYRKEIEILSEGSELNENQVAELVVELARLGAEANGHEGPLTGQRTHVGYYLIAAGRPALEKRIAYHPHGLTAARRWILQHAVLAYQGSTLLLTALLIVLLVAFIPAGAVAARLLVVLLLIVPALTIASNLVNWIITVLLPPRILAKLEFKEALPAQARSAVVVPALLTSAEEVDSLARQMEMHYLRNPEPGLVFVLLTDFADARQETLTEDDALVERAAAAIEALNDQYAYSDPTFQEKAIRPFYFFHRRRLWNEREGQWIGWERKRGKLHEFNRFLRGGDGKPSFGPAERGGDGKPSFSPAERGGDGKPSFGPAERGGDGKPSFGPAERGGKNLTFSRITGDIDSLRAVPVRYVVTLDADTVLPRSTACRLVGTLAHPLNHAVFDESTGQVVSGYTILQPRMEISANSANRSWFTRIFSGDTGLDLYSLAVSDTYQDLFGEGIFVGKGVYDVDSFERSVEVHIPENRLLSHDLLEGLMGRAGLVTDITMIEDYPPNYFVQVMRMQRWIRGDWQLLPWLINPGKFGVHFSAIDRWKIIDNLRRSLLAPSLLLLFILGVLFLPGPAWLWTAVVFIAPGVPVLTSLVRGVIAAFAGETAASAFRPVSWDLVRWLLAVTFLPYEAYISAEAVLITLYRLLISKRNLLQWTTAAQTARLFSAQVQRDTAREKLGAAVLFSLALAAGILLAHAVSWAGFAPVLLAAAPPLILWMLAPLIADRISQPIQLHAVPLDEAQEALLRQVARRTWSFFERYVGPEDHWLPPDHFQESPVGMVAHRTSPTNMGLLLTSTLAAYDLGYLDLLDLATRLAATLETFDQLERYQGHFLNWYDTLTLEPLKPRYVSTVDSGNLVACLIITAQACREMRDAPIFRWVLWQGYLDTLSILSDTLAGLRARVESIAANRPQSKKQPPGEGKPASSGQQDSQPAALQVLPQINEIETRITRMVSAIQAARNDRGKWYELFQEASGPFWQDVSGSLLKLVSLGRSAFDLEALRGLQGVASQVERHHLTVQRTMNELVPWIFLLENPPALLNEAPYRDDLDRLRANLPYTPLLGQIREDIEAARPYLEELRKKVVSNSSIRDSSTGDSAIQGTNHESRINESRINESPLHWLDALDQALSHAATKAGAMLNGYTQIAAHSEQIVREMDFRFLYNGQRRIFHIGYNLDSGLADANYYDLLASEARIASLIVIAQDQVPQRHWLQLARPVTSVEGLRVLLSWSATMFEYLMPPLFLPTYPGTLLAESARGAVIHQIAYGRSKGVPWGISESGFYRFDGNQNYQYRAFGVPGLGFKRGLGDDLVIAPYASLMAVCYDSQAVARNVRDLIRHKALGQYGFYEAIDFTTDRLLVGQTSALVREYMSHHQGMIMLALDNYFMDDAMVRRMHSDPRIQSIDLLLQEQIPLAAPLQSPYSEDVKGIQRLTTAQVKITPWTVPAQTPIPQAALLSNSTYSVLITNAGSGYSTWRDTDLTRWRPDSALDEWGSWIYIQDMDSDPNTGGLWSAGFQPIPDNPNNVQVTFFAHMVVIRRTERGIISTMEVTVPPDDPVEIRRVHLNNSSDRPRRIRLVSYGEVILAQQAADIRHPAFNRLFIESEFLPDFNMQIYKRRPRSDEEAPLYMAHMLITGGSRQLDGANEADRARFIGRDRDPRRPAALTTAAYLTGATGATLDPIFSIGQEVELAPFSTAQVAYLTFAAASREEILALAERFHPWAQVERAFHQADLSAQAWLGRNAIDSRALKNILQVLSGLIYPYNALGADPEVIAANRLGQPGLWRFGISGDFPILLVELDDPRHLELVRQAMEAHRYLRSRRFLVDLVILNQQQTDYGAELNGLLYRLASRVNSDQWLNQRGGIFILYADQMHPEERTLLRTAARVLLKGERGLLEEQLPGYSIQVPHLPAFVPTRSSESVSNFSSRSARREIGNDLQYFNGHGGFSPDGREYIIEIAPGKPTPAPWVNVIGYPQFGFLVSESGSQTTWAVNSGENRLTPWLNDPVRDPTGEALYLRDEETGEVWSPTPLPAGINQPESENKPYRARHGAGYTIFEHESHGLVQRLTLFASPEDPVKIAHLELRNTWDHTRRITATQYVEWVLGTTHAASQPFIIPEFDPERECLLAANPYNTEFAARTAFLSTSRPIHGLTADRTEFIGRNGSMAFPAALKRIGLERRITPGEDPCAVLQVHLDLLPGASQEVYFILGQGNDKDHALRLVEKYHDPAHVGAAWERTEAFWNQLLDAVRVSTPEPAVDLILNRWLLYQALSCRIWGRTALYQSSGAFGFRDQLQDVLALLPVDPAITRGQILNAAHHQFEAGDVLHWWHPPSGRGVRTRFSDDLLWLPYVTALYVEATGDTGILDEKIPFLQAPPLKEGEHERYGQYPATGEGYPLIEHCRRAVDKGATRGSHGLPLMGTGDWNDGMNLVGAGGKGESIWMAWFLVDMLDRFAGLYEKYAGPSTPDAAQTAARYREQAKAYVQSVEQSAWDGDWYRRAYYDDGAPLGSKQDPECKIDSIAQSWSVISGAKGLDPRHVRSAMQSLRDQLVRPKERLILLFTPPFDKTPRDPGYIKGYLPGTRENGGQYTHAATWAAWAFTRLGDGQQAGQLFDLLNPIFQADSEEKAAVYRVEPYVICADIYSAPPYVRRGGWTWYTGSAAWMYRLGLEAILGFQKLGDTLQMDPAIPPAWDGYQIDYRYGSSTYHIQVMNPQHVPHGVKSITVDGQQADGGNIPLNDDGKEHNIVLTMGK